jgi:hypothetical protein
MIFIIILQVAFHIKMDPQIDALELNCKLDMIEQKFSSYMMSGTEAL